jgi:Zn-finger nucleic acid-binding protein
MMAKDRLVCPFCKMENAPPPAVVEVPVPVQLVQNVVKVDPKTDKPKELRCPHCGKRLFGVKVQEVELAGCGGCGGIWVDNASSRSVLAKPQKIFADMAERAAENARGRFVRSERPTCPECPAILDHVDAHGIELDVCTDHGTWFDAHELDRLINTLRGDVVQVQAPANATMTTCTRCRVALPVDRTNITDDGLMCDTCFGVRKLLEGGTVGRVHQPTAAVGDVILDVASVLLGGRPGAK